MDQNPTSARELRLITSSSIYYLDGKNCFAVQDKKSGSWNSHHVAIGATLQIPSGDLLERVVRLIGCRAAFMRKKRLISTTTVAQVHHGWL
jgi:hypothetical protein